MRGERGQNRAEVNTAGLLERVIWRIQNMDRHPVRHRRARPNVRRMLHEPMLSGPDWVRIGRVKLVKRGAGVARHEKVRPDPCVSSEFHYCSTSIKIEWDEQDVSARCRPRMGVQFVLVLWMSGRRGE